MINIKFLDLFAGIGGFRSGLEMAGHECVGYYSEIDYKCLVTWYRGVFYCDVISYKIVQEEGYVVTVNSIDLADVEEEDIEIIGNQFENPELLEV